MISNLTKANYLYEKYGLIFLSVIVAFLLSYSIINYSPYILLILISAGLFLILMNNNEIGFYIILFCVFFADWLWHLSIIPVQLTWLPEIILIIYILKVFITKKQFPKTPLNATILAYVIVGIISAIVNNQNVVSVLLAFRLDFKFIIMFYLMLALNLKPAFYKTNTKLIIILLLIQIPVAIVKYFIYGQGEQAIGTYGAYGGTLSTFLPMISISIFLPLIIFKHIKLMWGLLAIFGYVVFSIVGGKKGLIYFGPPVVIFILVRALLTKYLRIRVTKALPIFFIILAMFLPIIYFVPWLQPAVVQKSYLKDFIIIYDIQYTPYGEPAGRIPSIISTFNYLKSDPTHFLLGYGPGSTIKSYFKQFDKYETKSWPMWVEYGVTELVQKPMEYGYLGVIFGFLLPVLILFMNNEKLQRVPNIASTKLLSFIYSSILFSYFIFGIAYSSVFRSDLPAYLFWFFASYLCKLKIKIDAKSNV